MFGNTLGWMIAGVIALLGIGGGYELALISQPTAPTGWVQQTIQPLTMGDLGKSVLDPMENLKDNAGDLYRHAAQDYEQHKADYEHMQNTRDFNASEVDSLAGLNDLITAAACPAMDLFKSRPDEIVGFNTTVEVLDDLDQVAKTAENVIALAKFDKNYDVAHKYANAVAALGLHLYQERVAYLELSAGENYLGTGIGGLVQIAQGQQADLKAGALQQFDDARKSEYADKIEPAAKVITGQGQQNIGEHAGDMYELASGNSFERVWRVEAIRKIGRLQFNAENRADQLKAPRFLKTLANDAGQDSVIRATAAKARDMTSTDNQSQR